MVKTLKVVINRKPKVEAGDPIVIDQYEIGRRLNGSASDLDGHTLDYEWSIDKWIVDGVTKPADWHYFGLEEPRILHGWRLDPYMKPHGEILDAGIIKVDEGYSITPMAAYQVF